MLGELEWGGGGQLLMLGGTRRDIPISASSAQAEAHGLSVRVETSDPSLKLRGGTGFMGPSFRWGRGVERASACDTRHVDAGRVSVKEFEPPKH